MKQIREWLDLPVIEIDQSQCLNEKSPSTICEKCVHACPAKALKIENKGVTLKEKACIDCTACVSACPTLSIEYVPKPYSKTINEITAYPTADVTCNQFEKYQKGIKIPCYLTFDLPMLLHYYTTRSEHKKKSSNVKLNLFVGKCETCKYKESFDIHEHIANLTTWSKELEIPIKIKLVYDSKKFLEKQSEVVSGITRRSLFKILDFRKTSEPAEADEIGPESLSYQDKNRYKKRLIAKGLEAAHEDQQRSVESAVMPLSHFAMLSKKEACRKCNICMRICPTDALAWVDTDSTATLNFYPKKCIACGRCRICPEESISISPIPLDVYHNEEIIQLAEISIKSCADCGETFKIDSGSSEEEAALCQLCTLKEEKKRALFDSL